MAAERYTRGVLTVIAAALVYLCLVLTPWPIASAQNAQRPGDPTGPAEVVVVGWRMPAGQAMPVDVRNTVTVSGQVRLNPGNGNELPLRVLVSGWEDNGIPFKRGAHQSLTPTQGLPIALR